MSSGKQLNCFLEHCRRCVCERASRWVKSSFGRVGQMLCLLQRKRLWVFGVVQAPLCLSASLNFDFERVVGRRSS
jgi:hypothetical protein